MRAAQVRISDKIKWIINDLEIYCSYTFYYSYFCTKYILTEPHIPKIVSPSIYTLMHMPNPPETVCIHYTINCVIS